MTDKGVKNVNNSFIFYYLKLTELKTSTQYFGLHPLSNNEIIFISLKGSN